MIFNYHLLFKNYITIILDIRFKIFKYNFSEPLIHIRRVKFIH